MAAWWPGRRRNGWRDGHGRRTPRRGQGATRRGSRLPDPLATVDPEAEQRAAFLAAVDAARREWLAARAYFDCVTDPDLIDYAIYTIEAAEKKYMYLLKRARERGYKIDFQEDLEPLPPKKLARL